MLGPVLFGSVIDRSCLLWERKCDGSTGTCVYYDNHEMAWLMFAVCVCCKVLSTVFGLVAWRLNETHKKRSVTTTIVIVVSSENGQVG